MTTLTINEYLDLPEAERPAVTYEGQPVERITPSQPHSPSYRIHFSQVRPMTGSGETLLVVATKIIRAVTLEGARRLVGAITPTRSQQRQAGEPVSRQYIHASGLPRIELEDSSLSLFALDDIYRLWPATREIDPMSVNVSVLTVEEKMPDLSQEQKGALQQLFNLARLGETSEHDLLEALPESLHPAQRVAAVRTIQGILNATR